MFTHNIRIFDAEGNCIAVTNAIGGSFTKSCNQLKKTVLYPEEREILSAPRAVNIGLGQGTYTYPEFPGEVRVYKNVDKYAYVENAIEWIPAARRGVLLVEKIQFGDTQEEIPLESFKHWYSAYLDPAGMLLSHIIQVPIHNPDTKLAEVYKGIAYLSGHNPEICTCHCCQPTGKLHSEACIGSALDATVPKSDPTTDRGRFLLHMDMTGGSHRFFVGLLNYMVAAHTARKSAIPWLKDHVEKILQLPQQVLENTPWLQSDVMFSLCKKRKMSAEYLLGVDRSISEALRHETLQAMEQSLAWYTPDHDCEWMQSN